MQKGWLTFQKSLLFAFIVSNAHPAQSQTVDNPEVEDEIVVTGVRSDAEPIHNKAVAFVKKIAARPVDGQLARWNEPICPKVTGLSNQHAEIVVKIIRSIANDAGAVVGKDVCRSNIIVTFTTKAADLMEVLVKRQPSVFSGVDPTDRKALLEGDRPVRWWYSTLSEGSDGHQITSSSAALLSMPDFPTPKSGKFLDSYHSTLIGTKLNVNLRTVAVVVDVDVAAGSTLKALSAYIAMVALAPAKLTANYSGLPSILALFPLDSITSRSELSKWDKAYMSSLYKVHSDRSARVQRSLIAGQMLKKLDK